MGRILGLAIAAFAVLALCINAIAVTDDWWVIALAVLAQMGIFTVIGIDVRRLMADDDGGGDRPPAPAPAPAYDGASVHAGAAFTGAAGDDRAVVLTTQPTGADDVLEALGVAAGPDDGRHLAVMVIAPEGFGHRNYDDERFYAQARRAEQETVDALRDAGVQATGHVGDHDAAQAIKDASVLFGATRVVVLARGDKEAAALRADVDPVALGRQARVSIEFVELRAGVAGRPGAA